MKVFEYSKAEHIDNDDNTSLANKLIGKESETSGTLHVVIKEVDVESAESDFGLYVWSVQLCYCCFLPLSCC